MKIKPFFTLFLGIILSLSTLVMAEPDPKFYIFICFGQSNMEGFPGVEEQDMAGVDERFQMLATVDFANMGRQKGNWYTAVPPLCRESCGLCPTDYFGRTLVEKLPADVRVGVINISVAGCSIDLFDTEKYQGYAATAPNWMKNTITTYGGNPYQFLIDNAREAQKVGVIKGILLHQGETNTGDQQWPDKVKTIYEKMLKDLQLKGEEVPLLIGELVNADQRGACASMNDIFAKVPAVIPNSHIISSKGCEGRTDRLHFAPAGYRELGRRYGQKMLELLGEKPAAAAAATADTIIPDPAWSCGMPKGIPCPELGEKVLDIKMNLCDIYNIGQTQYGQRSVFVAKDGTVSGDKFQGTVEPGAIDFELTISNGVVEIEQVMVLKASDGKFVYVRTAGTGLNKDDVRVVMDFEAPNGSSSQWLNSGTYVARRAVDQNAKTLTMTIYQLPAEINTTSSLKIAKPEGVAKQAWDFRVAAPEEKQGEQIISELVTLGASTSVGASKNGMRNIIPITGGTLEGMIKGKVAFGGADYQNLSNPATIDARYLWIADDGEAIIVRNAGQFGKLVPTFEAKADGKYAWLNSGKYLSSNPGMGANGVVLTMYKSK